MSAARTVEVGTEEGGTCVIEFEQEYPRVWTVRISQDLIEQQPEAIHAALGLALMQMRGESKERNA